eukprot:TRINITY_DN13871_c0_g1_i2.p1 TRINITY_DN13871_c0_g1~~TRINITY_DN13871_c0_g1_i2.p1  ORF type:complete len:294 (+),score=52.80 TRINITY_DN13871_c0_g1_i2:84-965(+)
MCIRDRVSTQSTGAHPSIAMACPYEAKIEETVFEGGVTYFVVQIQAITILLDGARCVTGRQQHWTIKRRYSQFSALREHLDSRSIEVKSFPRKHLVRSNSVSVVDERKTQLAHFLNQYALPFIDEDSAVGEFIDLDFHSDYSQPPRPRSCPKLNQSSDGTPHVSGTSNYSSFPSDTPAPAEDCSLIPAEHSEGSLAEDSTSGKASLGSEPLVNPLESSAFAERWLHANPTVSVEGLMSDTENFLGEEEPSLEQSANWAKSPSGRLRGNTVEGNMSNRAPDGLHLSLEGGPHTR